MDARARLLSSLNQLVRFLIGRKTKEKKIISANDFEIVLELQNVIFLSFVCLGN
jgi:hypothetical protein